MLNIPELAAQLQPATSEQLAVTEFLRARGLRNLQTLLEIFFFFLTHLGICSFCQSLLAMAITLSLLCCRRWLCPPRSIAWYRTNLHSHLKHYHVTHQRSLAFIPQNSHTMATTPRAQRAGQRGKGRERSSSSSCSRANFSLPGSFWVSS